MTENTDALAPPPRRQFFSSHLRYTPPPRTRRTRPRHTVRSDCYVVAAQFDRFALDPVRCPNIGYITVYRLFAERMRDPTPEQLAEYLGALLQPCVARILPPHVRAAARRLRRWLPVLQGRRHMTSHWTAYAA